jgi:hypothetical protein
VRGVGHGEGGEEKRRGKQALAVVVFSVAGPL